MTVSNPNYKYEVRLVFKTGFTDDSFAINNLYIV
jgi:hypothetical protein